MDVSGAYSQQHRATLPAARRSAGSARGNATFPRSDRAFENAAFMPPYSSARSWPEPALGADPAGKNSARRCLTRLAGTA